MNIKTILAATNPLFWVVGPLAVAGFAMGVGIRQIADGKVGKEIREAWK